MTPPLSAVRRQATRRGQAAARRLGFQVGRARFGQDLRADLARVLRADAVVVDAGANEGAFARMVLDLAPRGQVHAFEPAPPAFARLAQSFRGDDRVRANQLALTPDGTPVDLHLTENDVGSSILGPTASDDPTDRWRVVDRTVTVRSIRLDRYLAAEGTEHVDLLKSDTQGFDLDVLRSAGDRLAPATVGAVLVEVNFQSLYHGQARPWELVRYLEEAGFGLAGLYQVVRAEPGSIRWCDALFLPRPVGKIDEGGPCASP